jgi:hypothetical protein
VDLFHARQHLHDLACLLEFMLLDRTEEWLAADLKDLDRGDIDGICKAARAYPLQGASSCCQVCTGPSPAQTPSPRPAASRPAVPRPDLQRTARPDTPDTSRLTNPTSERSCSPKK